MQTVGTNFISEHGWFIGSCKNIFYNFMGYAKLYAQFRELLVAYICTLVSCNLFEEAKAVNKTYIITGCPKN